MKKPVMFIIAILIIWNLVISVYMVSVNRNLETFKRESIYQAVNNKRTNLILLKPNESKKVVLADREYTLLLKEIHKNEPCPRSGTTPNIGGKKPNEPVPMPCAWVGDYSVTISVNGIDFALTSEYNQSHPLISTAFFTNDVIYYLPEYSEKEAYFIIENDAKWEKETNLVIGNYLVYVNQDNKIIDINTFSREVQTWGKKYADRDLEDIEKLIKKGVDLKK